MYCTVHYLVLVDCTGVVRVEEEPGPDHGGCVALAALLGGRRRVRVPSRGWVVSEPATGNGEALHFTNVAMTNDC